MLAGYFFKRYPHPLAEWGDYLNLCSLGLLQAIERFDLTRGVRFKTYAEHFIKGAVLKGLASYIKDQRAISKERVESIGGVNRFDTKDSDLELVVNAAVGLAFGYFLELGIVEEQPADNDPLAQYVNHDISNELAHLVESLPERERQGIVGHYFQQMSFTSLSELLGVSRSRVSQLHGAALERIRFLYEGRGP